MTEDDWREATGAPLWDGETGMVLVRAKLTYCPPLPDILISRKGFAFGFTSRLERDPATKLQGNCDQVLRAITTDLDIGIRHTQNSLEALKLMPRTDLREAISTLIARGLVEHATLPDRKKGGTNSKKGGATTYLRPIAAPNDPGAPRPEDAQ